VHARRFRSKPIDLSDIRTESVARRFTGGDLMAKSEGSTGGWRKSSRSESGACVEVRIGSGEVLLRHSGDRKGHVLAFSYPEWQAFLEGAALGEFDLP